MKHILFTAMLMAALGACTEPNPPTVTARDVDRAFDEAERISALDITTAPALPTGTITYDGHVGTNVRGDAVGSILGDMTMIVGFASNDIEGSVTNINLIDLDGTPNQRFDGQLRIDGIERSGDLDAIAAGRLTAVDIEGFEVDTYVTLEMDGTVRDDRINGDAVYGTVDGSGVGDFYMDIEGVFFGTER